MRSPRFVLKQLGKSWDKHRFLDYLEEHEYGLEGIAQVLISIMNNDKDQRSRLKAVQMILEVAGLKDANDKSEVNVFLTQINNMPNDDIQTFLEQSQRVINAKRIEAKVKDAR